MLKSARRKLWLYGCLRLLCGGLSILYFVCFLVWLFFPGLCALAYLKIDTLTAVLIAFVFMVNFLILVDASELEDKHFRVLEWGNRIEERRKELKWLTESAMDAVRLLKRMSREKLDIYELDVLRSCLEDIGVDADPITILIYEYDKLKWDKK